MASFRVGNWGKPGAPSMGGGCEEGLLPGTDQEALETMTPTLKPLEEAQ